MGGPSQSGHDRRARILLSRVTLVLLACYGTIVSTDASGQDSSRKAVQDVISSGRIPWARWPDFSRYVDDLRHLYAAHTDSLIWFDGPFLSSGGSAAVAVLRSAGEHGFEPRDYDVQTLDRVGSQSVRAPLDSGERVRFDLLLSVNLIRFLDDLKFGRLHPQAFHREESDTDWAAVLKQALAGDSVARLVAATAPNLAQYRKLQRLLDRYRALGADSTFGPLPSTSPVYPGAEYRDVNQLRRRLAATGDLLTDTSGGPSGQYSEIDADAVRRFQHRHALRVDGILDAATFSEINVPFRQRARQIELALERLRWLPQIGGRRFVVVNIPAFQLFAFDSAGGSGVPSLGMRVIVGQALDTRTPVMLEQLRYLEFRPYWNVPRRILVGEILPLLQRNVRYLQDNDMEVVGPRDRVMGDVVSPEILDQLRLGELRVRQRPGPRNAMGLVKFVFPNSAAVYLHGTPRSELFSQSRRDLSHGCIRLEDPTALATWVLRDQPLWGRQQIVAAQAGRSSTRAWLPHPMPVIIFYTTAVAAPDGSAWFFTDIYGHDRRLDEALRAELASP